MAELKCKQKMIELFDSKVDIVRDSVDLMDSADDVYVKNMIKGIAFEEYSHVHCMYKFMKNNNVSIPETSIKAYKAAEEKLMNR